jgi:hypothetical protein
MILLEATMSITIELSPDLEAQLVAEAARLKLPISEYASRILQGGHYPTVLARTGEEVVKYWKAESVIGSRNDIPDSAQRSAELRHRSNNRA